MVIAVTGSVEISSSVSSAIQTGALEAEQAFARFSSICQLMDPVGFSSGHFEAQEGFWSTFGRPASIGGSASVGGIVTGELAWFQVGICDLPATTLMPIPLVLYAAAQTVEQLGNSSIAGFRIQVPTLTGPMDPETRQCVLDQFSVLAGKRAAPIGVRTCLLSGVDTDRWEIKGQSWIEEASVEPFHLRKMSTLRSARTLDDRWAPEGALHVYSAEFDSPEWSSAAAAAIGLFMIEAGHAAGITDTVVVEIEAMIGSA